MRIILSACGLMALAGIAAPSAFAGPLGSGSMAAPSQARPLDNRLLVDVGFRGGFHGGGGFDREGFHNNVVVNRDVNVGVNRGGFGYGWGGVAAGAAVGTAVGAAAASTAYAADPYPYGYPYPAD